MEKVVKIKEEIKINNIEVGRYVKVTIESYSHEGLGIAHIDGVNNNQEELTNFPIFVFNALIGETVIVKLIKVNKNLAYGEVDKLIESTTSLDRIKPICGSYAKCGGCNLLHMSYQAQLEFKRKTVVDTLAKLGDIYDVKVNGCLGMKSNPYYYRNKVQVPVQEIYKGKTVTGFFERETHKVIPLNECYIQSELSTSIIIFTKNILIEHGMIGYNEQRKTGTLRHILVRRNYDESEIMIVLVLKDFKFIDEKKEVLEEIISKIVKRYPSVKTIVANLNNAVTNTIIGDECKTLYGKAYINDILCGYKFMIGPKSFYQVNHEQCEVLYQKAIEQAKLTKNDIVIDAYCGIGTIGILAAKHVKEVYSVEIVDEAIKYAKKNAKNNNIDNITFECAPSEKQIIKWFEQGIKPNVIFVDPPRKGCDENFLDTIIKMNIERIVYISCDPATLARDLKLLVANNYKINSIQPIDMFSQNHHVETVVCLSRKTTK